MWVGIGKTVALWALSTLLVLGGPQSTAHASDEVLAALQQRGLAPWPEALLTEVPFAIGPDQAEVLETDGFKLRIPAETDAKIALIALPDRVVIVDLVAEIGPLALSPRALTALGLKAGEAPRSLQIIALRPYEESPMQTASSVPTHLAPRSAPIPVSATHGKLPAARSPSAGSNRSLQNPRALGAGSTSRSAAKPVTTIQLDQQVEAVATEAPAAALLALQAGYFRSAENADRFASELDALEVPTFVRRTIGIEGEARWKVLAGPFPDEQTRNAAKARGGALLADAYPVRL